jgi:hypothetical protein
MSVESEKPRLAYAEDLSKHRMKLPLYDLYPKTENAWIAPNATVSKYKDRDILGLYNF